MKEYSEKSVCSICCGEDVSKEDRPKRKLILRTCLRCGNLWYEKTAEKEVRKDGN